MEWKKIASIAQPKFAPAEIQEKADKTDPYSNECVRPR